MSAFRKAATAPAKTPRNVLQCRVQMLDGVNYCVQMPVSDQCMYTASRV
jgi:hypothetical protein